MKKLYNTNRKIGEILYEYFEKGVIASAALALPFAVSANSKLEKMMKDPNQWVQQSGDYAGHRYSELDQINKSNVGSLKVALDFSTGVLRGHRRWSTSNW